MESPSNVSQQIRIRENVLHVIQKVSDFHERATSECQSHSLLCFRFTFNDKGWFCLLHSFHCSVGTSSDSIVLTNREHECRARGREVCFAAVNPLPAKAPSLLSWDDSKEKVRNIGLHLEIHPLKALELASWSQLRNGIWMSHRTHL